MSNDPPAYSPGNPNCPICKGTGMIRLPGGLDSKQCECAFAMDIRRRIGEELALALPRLTESPLFEAPRVGGPAVRDLTRENLFIKCWWNDFKPHLRWVVINLLERSSLRWRWVVLTDERVKSVFVGNEAYAARAKKKREDVVTFNSLADLVGTDLDLVIVRLGFLGYKNVAMSGALKEALLIRQANNQPTWILEEPNSIFGPGHNSWSQDLAEYISSKFRIIDMAEEHPDIEVHPRGVAGAQIDSDDEGISVDSTEGKPAKVKMPTPSFTAPVKGVPSMIDDSVLFGTSGKKPFKRKGGGGGGPV